MCVAVGQGHTASALHFKHTGSFPASPFSKKGAKIHKQLFCFESLHLALRDESDNYGDDEAYSALSALSAGMGLYESGGTLPNTLLFN